MSKEIKHPLVVIQIEVTDCRQCPKHGEKLTKGYGYATDYFCTLSNNKIVSGYVEWESDINPVPDWCPIRIDKVGQNKSSSVIDSPIDIGD